MTLNGTLSSFILTKFILQFQDYVIWTDQGDMNGIHVGDIITKNKVRGILHPQTGVAYDVISYDEHSQPQLKGKNTAMLHK